MKLQLRLPSSLSIRSALLLLLLLPMIPTSASAQWKSDSSTNTVVCVRTNQQDYPVIIPDGSDGAFIVWEDFRNLNWDIFAQHLDAKGVKLWPDSGVAVCNAGADQRYPIICSDNAGGFYCVWNDMRNGNNGIDLYGQHILSDGTKAYAAAGLSIVSQVRDQENPSICADGLGNAFVAWEDNRSATSSTRPDIYMQRLNPKGIAWTANGLGITTQGNQQLKPKLVDDGTGGCLMVWENTQQIPKNLFASRIDSVGTVLWGGGIGLQIYKGETSLSISRNVWVTRDGSEFILAWEETDINTNNGQNIRANRIKMDGTKVWFTACEITPSWSSDQTNPRAFSDDSSGINVVFEDQTNGDVAPNFYNKDIAFVRVLPNGADLRPPYPNGFLYLAKQTHAQTAMCAVKSDDGLIAAWDDGRYSGDTAIFAQRVDRNLRLALPASAPSNVAQPISSLRGRVAKHVAIAPRTNGAIITWTDNRNGNFDIFAQLLFKNGTLPINLASFNVRAADGNALVSWSTASEHDNAGFEIERRRLDDGSTTNIFATVASYTEYASLRAQASASGERHYSYTDDPGAAGRYEYRLVDIGLDGTRTPHEAKQIVISTARQSGFSLEDAQPNPVRDRVFFGFTSPVQARAEYVVTDVLGRVVNQGTRLFSSGAHKLELNVQSMQLAAGTYYVRVNAFDASSNQLLWSSENSKIMKVFR